MKRCCGPIANRNQRHQAACPLGRASRWRLRKTRRAYSEPLEARVLLSTYTITDLGTLPGATSSEGTGINDSGQIVGNSGVHPFLYSNGIMRNLGPDYFPQGTNYTAEATSINDWGEVTGDADNPLDRRSAFVFSNGQVQYVPLAGTGFQYSWARDINDADQVVGYTEFSTSAYITQFAFLYENGTRYQLQNKTGPDGRYAWGINDAGQIVGQLTNGHSFIYTPSGTEAPGVLSDATVQDLGTLPGDADSTGYRINNAGQVIGWDDTPGGGTRGFLYSGGVMEDLGFLPYGINNAGQVVGFNFALQRPVIYSDGTTTDLNTAIPAGTPWHLISAGGINNRGQIVCTASADGLATTHAVLLTPGQEPLPDFAAAFTAAPEKPQAGDTLSPSLAITNVGTGAAISTDTTEYWISQTPDLSGTAVKLATVSDRIDLQPGQATTVTASLTIPTSTQTGTYYVVARTNADGAIQESDSGNDTNDIAVSAPIEIGPAVTPTSLTWHTTSVGISGVDYTYTVDGGALQDETVLALYWSPTAPSDPNFDPGQLTEVAGTDTEDILPVGTASGQYTEHVSGSLLAGSPDGTTYVVVAAGDPRNKERRCDAIDLASASCLSGAAVVVGG